MIVTLFVWSIVKGRTAMGVPTVVPGSADTFIERTTRWRQDYAVARAWTRRAPIPVRLDNPAARPAPTDDDACTDADLRRVALSAR